MNKNNKIKFIYLGYNNFKEHKRGIENVIAFQSNTFERQHSIYISFGKTAQVYRWGNIACVSLEKNIFRFIILNYLIYKIWRKNKNIFIHSHNYLMSFFLFRKTDLFSVHDGLYYQAKCLKRKFLVIFKFIEFSVYLRCKKVHFISIFSKYNSLFRGNTDYKIIPNTSHLESFSDNTENVHSSSSEDILVPEEFVLSVRSIEERARIDLLIDVAEKYKENGGKLSFAVAGKGPLLEFYRNEIKKRGITNVYLLGFISDKTLVELYKKCRGVLIMAEYAEGFGLPIIESYLYGKPVIASNRCAIPEIVINHEYLFENEITAILEKMDYLLKNSTDDYSSYYFEKFGNSTVHSLYRKCYLGIIENRHEPRL